jgi:hypothetical protein
MYSTSIPPRPGALLGISRAGVVALLLLAVFNGVFLYGLPALTGQRYAWVIALPINAAFLGAGYLAGTLATALVVFKTRSWRSLRMLPLPLVVLSLGLLAATLLHADLFRWDYPLTWVWTAVYATVPFGVTALWLRQERSAPPAPPRAAALRPVRLASAALGILLAVVALGLFLAPQAAAELWPWPVTALLARALGSWYALVATALLVCAWSLRRPVEAVIPYATLLAWSLLLLLLPVLHPGSVHAGPELGAWIAAHVALVALSLAALRVARRSPGELL